MAIAGQKPELRSEKLDLRLTPAAKQTLQRAAAAAQRSVTDFVLESALASAAETLADRRVFALDPERWQAFVAALDAPPQRHPRIVVLKHRTVLFRRKPLGRCCMQPRMHATDPAQHPRRLRRQSGGKRPPLTEGQGEDPIHRIFQKGRNRKGRCISAGLSNSPGL
jgi:uncharacterized protein (DUF1778 family)